MAFKEKKNLDVFKYELSNKKKARCIRSSNNLSTGLPFLNVY